MSAQPERTPETTIADWQVTPVIIKTGGDDNGVDLVTGQSPVTINLEHKTFESLLKDDEWRSAVSTVTAGIASVAIEDGVKSVGPFTSVSESEELITLQVVIGPDLLMISEEAPSEPPHRTRVVITSAIPFRVVKHGARTDQWSEASAPYPVAKPLVILTQGNHILANYQCETTDVTLTLGLDWDETGG